MRHRLIAILTACLVLGSGLAYFGAMTALGITLFFARDLPSPAKLNEPNRPVSIQFLDRNGQVLLVRGAHQAATVKAADLPPVMKQAIYAVEDRRFEYHVGVDPIGLSRALYRNYKAKTVVAGGSTITQQLVKNVFLSPEQTFKRKVQEALLSVWMEKNFSKDEILEKYLSRVYYGSGIWGIEAASQAYFQKPAADLDLGEAALLSGVLQAPTRFNPVANPDGAGRRTATVLAAMDRVGFISRAERAAALHNPIHVRPAGNHSSVNYFADWVWPDIEALIGTPTQDIVVRTTLDASAQAHAERAASANIDEDKKASQIAILTLDGTGGVRAMIGGRDYSASQYNRAVSAKRQPGSAFKAFVYLSAFEAGLTPWDRRLDEPIKIDDWEPGNFSNTFKGEMSLEEAFAASINTVAVTLAMETGLERLVDVSARLGLADLKPYPSLSLGAQDMSLLDLTRAYQPFSSYGNMAQPHGILSISTGDGTPIYDAAPPAPARVIGPEALGHMNRIMTQTVKTGTGRAAGLPGRDVGGKTGTTNDYRDAWFVGYVPDLVTGVWTGNDENLPMARVTGGTIPARTWHDMMDPVLADMPIGRLPESRPAVRAQSEDNLNVLLQDIQTTLP